MSCKSDWRWQGKCSSPNCCKGGRRKSRRKKGRGTPKTLRKTLMKKKKRRDRSSTLTHIPSERTLSKTSVNTTFEEPSDPRHQLATIIGAGPPGQTDDQYRRRIAAVVAKMPGRDGKPGSTPRMKTEQPKRLKSAMKRIAIIREQYGGKKRRTRRRTRRRKRWGRRKRKTRRKFVR